jgi:hypothetical protein
MENKRNSKRINFKERVKYGTTDKPNTEGYSHNISKSGIAIKSYKEPSRQAQKSQLCSIQAKIPYDWKVKLYGTRPRNRAPRLKWELRF